MYELSGRERLIPIEPALPEADAGAPTPRIAASEGETIVAYWTAGEERAVVVVNFDAVEICFGGPNDEALAGHPLYKAGLKPYTFAEVIHSPWIDQLERRNRVHPRHDPSRFRGLRHFVLPFHDSTFECVAREARSRLSDADDPAAALRDE